MGAVFGTDFALSSLYNITRGIMMNLNKLTMLGTTLFLATTVNANALVCESQMINQNGGTIESYLGNGNTERAACLRSRRECRVELNQLQNRGRRLGADCIKIGVVADGRDNPREPREPRNPRNPRRPGNYELDSIERTIAIGGWQARQYAARDLAQYPSVRSMVIALKTLSDSDSDVRKAAQNSLNQIKRSIDLQFDAVELMQTLPALMGQSSWKVRQEGAKIMGMLGTAEAILPLIKFASDSDSDVRAAAKASIKVLSNSYDLQRMVKQNLGELKNIIKSSGWSTRQQIMKILGKAKVIKSLVIIVKTTGDSDADVRKAAVKAMKSIINGQEIEYTGQRLINKLENLYRTSGWNVRMNAVKVLGATRNPNARNVLYDALSDSDSDVRAAAKVALRNM